MTRFGFSTASTSRFTADNAVKQAEPSEGDPRKFKSSRLEKFCLIQITQLGDWQWDLNLVCN